MKQAINYGHANTEGIYYKGTRRYGDSAAYCINLVRRPLSILCAKRFWGSCFNWRVCGNGPVKNRGVGSWIVSDIRGGGFQQTRT